MCVGQIHEQEHFLDLGEDLGGHLEEGGAGGQGGFIGGGRWGGFASVFETWWYVGGGTVSHCVNGLAADNHH